MPEPIHPFSPEDYEPELEAIVQELLRLEAFDAQRYEAVLRRHPKDGDGFFSKSHLIRGFRHLNEKLDWRLDERQFVELLRMKPVRTLSGVAPVTVLTRPYPCPGECIFCPSDVRMPKSYISSEPGAQRAAQHQFDPYRQSFSRLLTYHNTGHPTDKIELIILGGTWSFYPESFQTWFVKRCLEALNDFDPARPASLSADVPGDIDYTAIAERVDGRRPSRTYNQAITDFARQTGNAVGESESTSLADLHRAQIENETARSRCVGLTVETRPDHLSLEEVIRLRSLGATKVQIGFQSLSDEVLRLNRRGHDVAATRRAMNLLRQGGFKIHAHWMPNLYGSSPARDIEDFERIFADPDFRPDELKIYPCSLVQSAELMAYYDDGRWRPYSAHELLEVVAGCMSRAPEYCRLTRVVRDIPGTEIVDGSRVTNLRQVVGRHLAAKGLTCRDIRAREIRHREIDPARLHLDRIDYQTSLGREVFLQFVTRERRIAAFLRLSLPSPGRVRIAEIAHSAMIREVHVYGQLASFGQRQGRRSQHLGLGRELVASAARIAAGEGYPDLAVISAIGTRPYYRRLEFRDGGIYQHRQLRA